MALVTVVRTTGSPVSVPDSSSPGAAGYGIVGETSFTGTLIPSSSNQQLAAINVQAIVAPCRVQFQVLIPVAIAQTIAGGMFFAVEALLDDIDLDAPFELRIGSFPSGLPDPANSVQETLTGFGVVDLLDTDVHTLEWKGRTDGNTTATIGFGGVDARFWILANVAEAGDA